MPRRTNKKTVMITADAAVQTDPHRIEDPYPGDGTSHAHRNYMRREVERFCGVYWRAGYGRHPKKYLECTPRLDAALEFACLPAQVQIRRFLYSKQHTELGCGQLVELRDDTLCIGRYGRHDVIGLVAHNSKIRLVHQNTIVVDRSCCCQLVVCVHGERCAF